MSRVETLAEALEGVRIPDGLAPLTGAGEFDPKALVLFTDGAPPHGGFAFGIDRLVAILAGEENIREVIAFPKTQSGADPLTDSPGPIDPGHLAELGLRALPPATCWPCGRGPTTWC